MPIRGESRKVRSKEGRELDRAYARHEIGWAYYRKIYNKSKYWTQSEDL